MTQSSRTQPTDAWNSLTEYQRAEQRAMGSAVAGIVFFILGLTLGVMLMDRVMPTSRGAAEQAMALPLTD